MRKRSRQQIDPEETLIQLVRSWVDGDKTARKKAEPIFKKHPELMNKSGMRMELPIYMAWHKFIATPHEKELTGVFNDWKKAAPDKKQEIADKANEVYLELTGHEIPSVQMFGEDESFEEFWIMGTRYEAKLQKIREEQKKKS